MQPDHHTLFLSTTPGLVAILAAEIHSRSETTELRLSIKEIPRVGVELTGTIRDLMSVAESVRSSSLARLRVASFKATDYPKFYQRLKRIDWRHWLTSAPLEISISCSKSRLSHSGRAEETAIQAIKDYQKHQPLKKSLSNAKQCLFLRIHQDQVEVSIGLHGELLHKRTEGHNYKTNAPLRENLAAGVLRWAWEFISDAELAVDPFCGSGVFASEWKFANTRPSSDWTWRDIPIARGITKVHHLLQTSPNFPKWVFADQDPAVERILETNGLSDEVTFHTRDIRKTIPPVNCDLVITNPPYGKRYSTPWKGPEELRDIILKSYRPKHLLLVLPSQQIQKLRPHHTLSFSNGGLSVQAGHWDLT